MFSVRWPMIAAALCLALTLLVCGCGGEGDDEDTVRPGDDDDDTYVPPDDDDDDTGDDDDTLDDDTTDDDTIDDDTLDDDTIDDDTGDDDTTDDDTGDDDTVPLPTGMIVTDHVEGYTDLQLDGEGRPHLVYKEKNGGLWYGRWTGSEWELEEVDDTTSKAGWYAAIVLDGDDTPYIAYQEGRDKKLKFATPDADGWSVVVVDESAEVGSWCDVALSPTTGYPLISYYDETNGDLKVAAYDGSAWTAETVDSATDCGAFTALDFAGDGTAWIAYYDAQLRSLKVASGEPGDWTVETVDAATGEDEDRGRWTSLAVDALDNVHVAYQDAETLDLKYAFHDGAWATEVVDAIGNKGADACLRTDADNLPRIVYQDGSELSMRLAKIVGGDWQISVLMNSATFPGSFGYWIGCDLRTMGSPVVSHFYPLEEYLLIYPAYD